MQGVGDMAFGGGVGALVMVSVVVEMLTVLYHNSR